MRKLIAAINLTLDGFCDHTLITPDEAVHRHYAGLLRSADTALYGRVTYQLMQFWQALAITPSGEQTLDDFAVAMDRIPKIVFSKTLVHTGWASAQLADQPLADLVKALKQASGRDILVGSRSLMLQLMKLGLIDEYQLCYHPIVAGGALPLFDGVNSRVDLKLIGTKTFDSGAMLLYYEPAQKAGKS